MNILQVFFLSECDSSMYPRPTANAGNQVFPSPFLPGTAVNYTCANGFILINEQTFMCNADDGSFTPLIPPNCTQGKMFMISERN